MTEWTRDMVEERITEAAAVLKRLPPAAVAGYFGTWPEIQRTAKEIAEGIRDRCGCRRRAPRRSPGWRKRSPGTASLNQTTPT